MKQPTSPLSRKLIHSGMRIDLYHVTVPTDAGSEIKEYIDHPGAVVILPIHNDGSVCLIQNWRYSANMLLWELPAGTLERGEAALPAAQRELAEETGYTAKHWQLLTEFWVAPGVYGEKMWLYVARDLTPGPQRLDSTECIQPMLVPWGQAMQMALQGTIQDAKTLCGLLLWDRRRHETS